MLPLKRVLCPIDFSEPSLVAANVAAELSLYFRARLTCLHVVSPQQTFVVSSESLGYADGPLPAAGSLDARRRSAEIRLAEVLHDLLDPLVDLSLRVVTGIPATAILQVAEETDTSLIVIASHGRRGWRRLLYGSVTELVMRGADRPLLVVRPDRVELERLEAEGVETARV